MLLIPALGRQRQADLYEFEASLVYRASSRTARSVTQRNPALKKETTKIKGIFEKKRKEEKENDRNSAETVFQILEFDLWLSGM